MKKLFVLVAVFAFISSLYAKQSIYKALDDSTYSGISEGSLIPEANRPAGFIIKHVKDDVDHDGVKDANDECNDTPYGKVVTENGCIKLIRLNVKFDFDKFNIKNEYKNEIKQAVDFLKKNTILTTTVEGHTDSVGKFDYNQVLSEKRAQSVAEVLVEKGINKTRIITKGFGETVPVATNNTEEGRALNRRVDISFNKK